MPRIWHWLLGGLCVLTLSGLGIWAKDRLTTPATNTPRALALNAHYGPNGPVDSGEPAFPQANPVQPTAEEPLRFPTSDRPPEPVAPMPALLPTNPTIQRTSVEVIPPQPPVVEPAPMPAAPVPQPPQAVQEPYPPAPVSPPAFPPAQPVYPPAPPVQTALPTPPPTIQPMASEPAPIACPWLIKLEIVEGRSRLEARTEAGTLVRISCGKLGLAFPDGQIEANGHVAFTAGTMEGSCERLTLSWRDSQIVLVGKVRLKGRQDEQEVDLAGDSLTFKLAPAARAKRDNATSTAPGVIETVPAPIKPVEFRQPEPLPTPPVPENGNHPSPLGGGLSPGVSKIQPKASSPTPTTTTANPRVGVGESHGPTPPVPAVGVSEHRTPTNGTPVQAQGVRPVYASR